MVPAPGLSTGSVPPPAYQRVQAKVQPALHIDALTPVTRLHLPALCRLAVRLAQRHVHPLCPLGPEGTRRSSRDTSLRLFALLRTLWRLSYQDMCDWLHSWSALALAGGLPLDAYGQPRIPSTSQQWKRERAAGAPVAEALLILAVQIALRCRLIGARDLIIDSAPILAWWRRDPDAQVGHAPARHPGPLLRGIECIRCSAGVRAGHCSFCSRPRVVPDAPFARPLLAWALILYRVRPRVIRLDAGYWGLRLIAWIHTVLGAVAILPWNPKRQRNRSCLPPTWTAEEPGKRTAIERSLGAASCSFASSDLPYVAGRRQRQVLL